MDRKNGRERKDTLTSVRASPHSFSARDVRLRLRGCVCVRLRPCVYVRVRVSTSASVHLRSRQCVYVHVRASAFIRVHIIKLPDASGRVFLSRTFEMHYIYMYVFYYHALVAQWYIEHLQLSAGGSGFESLPWQLFFLQLLCCFMY